jgi:glycosyltransferase involved in cell wall biosynthesis
LVITSTRPGAAEKKSYQELTKSLKIQHRVKFLDLVDYELLPVLYANAVCYLSCSYDEMLGTTSSNLPVKEALACGTPAIRANITTEDVVDGESGFLVDPKDTLDVAQKVLFLINNPKLARKMGLEGRKKIKKLYQWPQVTAVIQKHISQGSGD